MDQFCHSCDLNQPHSLCRKYRVDSDRLVPVDLLECDVCGAAYHVVATADCRTDSEDKELECLSRPMSRVSEDQSC